MKFERFPYTVTPPIQKRINRQLKIGVRPWNRVRLSFPNTFARTEKQLTLVHTKWTLSKSARNMSIKDCFMASTYLDTYCGIPIKKSLQSSFPFQFQGKYYISVSWQNGPTTTPKSFSNIIKQFLSTPQKLG